MLSMVINGLWTTASTLFNLSRNNVATAPPSTTESTSQWRTLRALLFSALSRFSVPLARSIVENTSLYECVNAVLATSTSHTIEHHRQRRNGDGISRLSRPHFRRRSRSGGVVRIIKPTINIVVHRN